LLPKNTVSFGRALTESNTMGRRLLREPEVLARIPVGRTMLEEQFVKTGRLKWCRIGERIKAAPEDEVDRLVDEIVAARDAELAVATVKADAGVCAGNVAKPDKARAPPPKHKKQKTTRVPARQASSRRARASA
jgi:hypothetical protein